MHPILKSAILAAHEEMEAVEKMGGKYARGNSSKRQHRNDMLLRQGWVDGNRDHYRYSRQSPYGPPTPMPGASRLEREAMQRIVGGNLRRLGILPKRRNPNNN
jgi:hypothetical protein